MKKTIDVCFWVASLTVPLACSFEAAWKHNSEAMIGWLVAWIYSILYASAKLREFSDEELDEAVQS